MATVVELQSEEELCSILSKEYMLPGLESSRVRVCPLGTIDTPGVPIFDPRTRWYTYAVLLEGKIIGFTDGPIVPRE